MTFPISAILSFLLLSGNWWIYFHSWLPNFAGPLWSISIEEQFYLIWPFIARWGAKRFLWLTTLVSFVMAYSALYILGGRMVPRYMVWTNSFVQCQFFAAGAVIALLLHKRTVNFGGWLRLLTLTGGLITLYAAVHSGIMDERPSGPAELMVSYPIIIFSVTLLFFTFYGARVPAAAKPLLYLGKISYGLYVFHLFAIVVVSRSGILQRVLHTQEIASLKFLVLQTGLALLLTIGLAAASYHLLELPFLRLKRRFTFVRNRPS